jgi:hypothetical protein
MVEAGNRIGFNVSRIEPLVRNAVAIKDNAIALLQKELALSCPCAGENSHSRQGKKQVEH